MINKTILITGAKGFLGRNLVEGLSDKYNLLLPTHIDLDLLDKAAVEQYFLKNNINTVIHAAAVGVVRTQNFSETLQKNLDMFFNLAEQHTRFEKMIFCGSGAVYDKHNSLNLVTEGDFGKSVPIDPYGEYKYKCSEYIEKSEKILDLRLFGVFGKYEDYATRFISNAICKSIFDMQINIIKDVSFEYLYVNDFVKIVDHFINNEAKYKAYNVGTGVPVKLSELAQKIKSISKNQIEVVVKSEDLGNDYTCDSSRLKAELPDFAFTPLDTSLKELYNWYELNKSNIDKARLE